MKKNYKKDAIVALIMLVAVISLASTIAPFFHPPKEVEALNTFTVKKDPNLLIPEHLYIPLLGIDAPVEQLGISTENSIMAPTQPGNVAWYKYGPQPGGKGTAIISGHIDWIGGLPAVFKDLNTLTTGADIYIEGQVLNTSNSTNHEAATSTVRLHYKVKEIKTVDYADNRILQEALQQKNTSEIMLITCFGEWLSENKTFDKRLIVVADLVSE